MQHPVPATTEIGLILTRTLVEIGRFMNVIPVGGQCTPGLVADVRIVDTPDASSCSKTLRKGSTREAELIEKHKLAQTES